MPWKSEKRKKKKFSMVGQKETKKQISSDHRKEIKDKIQSLGFMVKSSANYVFSASCMPTTN